MEPQGRRRSNGHEEPWNLNAKDAGRQLFQKARMAKYWKNRHQLFSRLEEGIKMDLEGWYSVTPEKNAAEIAYRMVKMRFGQPSDTDPIILDGFAGVGGNSIQFANADARVIAVDIDEQRLRCAKANATVYGVQDYIEFILGDFFHVLQDFDNIYRQPIDAIFLSPPWGGPSYAGNWGEQKKFDPEVELQPVGATELIGAACRVSKNIALYLPKNTIEEKIPMLPFYPHTPQVEKCVDIYGNPKALIAYYGDLKLWSRDDEEHWAEARGALHKHYWSQQEGMDLPAEFGKMSINRRPDQKGDEDMAVRIRRVPFSR